jgi:lysine-specific demethylase/histidyl-hydroxylase NO66
MADPVPSALGRCVGDVDRFLRDTWGRAPLHHRQGAHRFDDLVSMADVDRMVASMGLRRPAFRLVKDGRPLAPASYTRTTRTGSMTATGVADPGRIFQHFREGATIVLQGMQRFWPPLTLFCRELELELGHPTQANGYVTPPGARGLTIHSDEHDVLVLQAFGSKHWEVYEPGANATPGARTFSAELRPGDALYLPVGTPHAARTQDLLSGHLTVGILAITWRQVLPEALKLLEADPALDERLPVGFHRRPEELVRSVQGFLGDLEARVGKLEPEALAIRMLRSFLTSRQPLPAGGLDDWSVTASLSDGSTVRRRRGSFCELLVRGGRLLVFLGDRELAMPPWVEPAVRWVAQRGARPFEVRELGGLLDRESRLVLVRRLVTEGLLEVLVDP